MDIEKVGEKIGTRRKWVREFLSEMLGTFIIVFVGSCCIAQKVLTPGMDLANCTTVNLGYGFGVLLAVLVSGPSEALDHFDNGVRHVTGHLATANIFSTYPAPFDTLHGALINELMATFVLVLVLCGIIDANSWGVTPALLPLYVGILIVTLINGFSVNTGTSLNPARDLSPRIFCTIAGWGAEAFMYRHYWWVPIVGPHLGGILGALFYVLLVEMHHNTSSEEP